MRGLLIPASAIVMLAAGVPALAQNTEISDSTATAICEEALDSAIYDGERDALGIDCATAMQRRLPVGLYVSGLMKIGGWYGTTNIAGGVADLDAASGRYPNAAMELGNMYHQGEIIPRDFNKALTYYASALRQGDALAAYYMAEMYLLGEGTQKDVAEGHRLMVYASDKGVSGAGQWMNMHPEVNAASVRTRNIDYLDIPKSQFTKVNSDGLEWDFRIGMRWNLSEYYPARALDNQVSGKSVTECRYTREGRLENCIVISEDPAGYGFGRAAIAPIRRTFRLPAGQEAAFHTFLNGRAVRFTFHWRMN